MTEATSETMTAEEYGNATEELADVLAKYENVTGTGALRHTIKLRYDTYVVDAIEYARENGFHVDGVFGDTVKLRRDGH